MLRRLAARRRSVSSSSREKHKMAAAPRRGTGRSISARVRAKLSMRTQNRPSTAQEQPAVESGQTFAPGRHWGSILAASGSFAAAHVAPSGKSPLRRSIASNRLAAAALRLRGPAPSPPRRSPPASPPSFPSRAAVIGGGYERASANLQESRPRFDPADLGRGAL